MQATARIYFQTAPAKRTKDKLCPVKLCVTHNRERKYYSITEKLTDNSFQYISPDDIEKVSTKSPRGKYKDISLEYKRIVGIAEDKINEIDNFSFHQFEEKFFNRTTKTDNVFAAMWNHILELRSEDRIGYATTYEATLRAIKEYHTGKKFDFNPRKDKTSARKQIYISGKELKFVDITPTWLKKFEKWMLDNGKSETTCGIYMRNLRVVFNAALKKGIKAPYPFNEYTPISTQSRKMALEPFEIAKILNYQTDDPNIQKYRDLFMLSFFCNGTNISDLARLKWSNIENGQIKFIRKKTEHKRKKTYITIEITPIIQEILDTHSIRSIGHDGYVLPILKPEWNEEKCYYAIKQVIKMINKYIRFIAKEVDITTKISTYTARHSFASINSALGVNTIKLKDLLGHSATNVTEGYIKSIDRKTQKEIGENLQNLIANS